MEKAMTVNKVAHAYGYPEAFVRGACHREAERHPIPHVRSGASRGCIRIRPSVFEQWVVEEESLNAGGAWKERR